MKCLESIKPLFKIIIICVRLCQFHESSRIHAGISLHNQRSISTVRHRTAGTTIRLDIYNHIKLLCNRFSWIRWNHNLLMWHCVSPLFRLGTPGTPWVTLRGPNWREPNRPTLNYLLLPGPRSVAAPLVVSDNYESNHRQNQTIHNSSYKLSLKFNSAWK